MSFHVHPSNVTCSIMVSCHDHGIFLNSFLIWHLLSSFCHPLSGIQSRACLGIQFFEIHTTCPNHSSLLSQNVSTVCRLVLCNTSASVTLFYQRIPGIFCKYLWCNALSSCCGLTFAKVQKCRPMWVSQWHCLTLSWFWCESPSFFRYLPVLKILHLPSCFYLLMELAITTQLLYSGSSGAKF